MKNDISDNDYDSDIMSSIGWKFQRHSMNSEQMLLDPDDQERDQLIIVFSLLE